MRRGLNRLLPLFTLASDVSLQVLSVLRRQNRARWVEGRCKKLSSR